MNRLLFDIEADNLLENISKIHCAVVVNLDTNEITEFTPENIMGLFPCLAKADQIYGHNIISYDLPALKKIYPDLYDKHLKKFEGTEGEKIFDTMVLARLVWSDIASMDMENLHKKTKEGKPFLELPEEKGAVKKLVGSHSLRAWGYRMRYLKGNADGEVSFDTWTPTMSEYCKRDGLVNARLVKTIESKAPTEFSVWIEHQFYRYLEYQQSFGVQFDDEYAKLLCKYWEIELEKRIKEMRALVPDIIRERTFTPKVNNTRYGYTAGVPVTKKTVVKFNPTSNDHVIQFLVKKYKWIPAEFTKKKKPAVTYDILKNLSYVECPLLARIRLLKDRIGLVKTEKKAWLKVQRDDGRIYGRIIHNGTNTHRCRHIDPNLGNIPSPKSIWGKPLRKTFKCAKGFALVGIDADGMEMRLLAHELQPHDGGAFYQMAFYGSKEEGTDAHTLNKNAIVKEMTASRLMEFAMFMTRDKAKTDFYAWLYGAWCRKLGQIVVDGLNVSVDSKLVCKIGECVEKGFKTNIKGIDNIISYLESVYDGDVKERRWPHLVALDGRRIPIRKKSALLNSLLQANGAVLMKLVPVILMRKLFDHPMFGEPGKTWRPNLHVHDELQIEVKNEGPIISEFLRLAVESFEEAGKRLGIRVPIIGSPSVGRNWAETH